MKLDYVPLLQVQRDLQAIPRGQAPDFNGMRRFKQYLRTIKTADGKGIAFPSLVAANPMAKDHVTVLLDALLALDADGVAARAVAETSAHHADVPGEVKATLVVVDDWMGDWTNRVPTDFGFRFLAGPPNGPLPRWLEHMWVTGVLWSSEPASERTAREAILTAVYRMAYIHRHGPARTLRDMIAQEGAVLTAAGCTGPTLDADDLAYTREVLVPYLDTTDMRTCCECLFGDALVRGLGFTPQGLSPWAGIAVGLQDARSICA
jgi:hypothetical protein